MKIGFYDDFRPCVVTERGVVDVSDVVGAGDSGTPQLLLESIIRNFDQLRPALEAAAESGDALPLDQVACGLQSLGPARSSWARGTTWKTWTTPSGGQ